MFLIQCKCGCIFTLKDFDSNRYSDKTCQNCGYSFRLDDRTSQGDRIKELQSFGIKIQRIPDNAKINISFNV